MLYHLAYLTWQTMPLLEKREVAPLAFLVPPAGVLVVGVGHFAVGTGSKATKKGFLALYKTLSYTMAAVALAYAAYVALVDGAARMSYPASRRGTWRTAWTSTAPRRSRSARRSTRSWRCSGWSGSWGRGTRPAGCWP